VSLQASITQIGEKGTDLTSQLSALQKQMCKTPPKSQGNFFFGGEFLYWKAYNPGLVFAVTQDITSLSFFEFQPQEIQLGNHQKMQYTKFDYEPGFRLNIGYQFPIDPWDLNFIWTRIECSKKQSIESKGTTIIAEVWDESSLFLNTPKLSNHSKLDLNILDLELGRSVFFSPHFSIRPFMGARGLFIDLDDTIYNKNVTYGISSGQGNLVLGSGNATIKLGNDCKGVGLRAGFDMQLSLEKGWGIYGLGSFSLLWEKFNLTFNQENTGTFNNDPLDLVLKHIDHHRAVKTALQAKAGVNWQTSLRKNRYHFVAFAGYEFNSFINHFQLKSLISPGNVNGALMPTSVDDISFQGLTMGAQFHF
jgi:hypothetical protein